MRHTGGEWLSRWEAKETLPVEGVVHQIWWNARGPHVRALPRRYEEVPARWVEWGHAHVLWSGDDLLRLAQTSLGVDLAEVSHLVHRVDLARLVVLYVFGGMYADLDVECRGRAWEEIAKEGAADLYVPESPLIDCSISNCLVVATRPALPVLRAALDRGLHVVHLLRTSPQWPVRVLRWTPYLSRWLAMWLTGPGCLASALAVARDARVRVLPAERFYHPGGVLVHHEHGTWI